MNEQVRKDDITWEEYEYRHKHIWSNVYKLTFAVSLLSVLPYVHREVVCVLGCIAVWPAVLAIALSVFGLVRGYRELKVLKEIRTRYRIQQGTISILKKGWFTSHMLAYLIVLLISASANLYVVHQKWIPAVHKVSPDLCFATGSDDT
jgi:hypothetical protein